MNEKENKNGSVSIVVILILVVLVIAAIYIINKPEEKPSSSNSQLKLIDSVKNEDNSETLEENLEDKVMEKTIEISSSGFSPSLIEINKGGKITFINRDNENHLPASAIHPTHTVYPGSNIDKCGTSEEKIIFDACRGLSTGESYSFVFNEKGTWGYHDHLNANLRGTIKVI